MPEVEDDEAAGTCGCGEVVSGVGDEGGEESITGWVISSGH